MDSERIGAGRFVITIASWKINKVVEWCEQNVGERKYWIHNQIGGYKWKLRSGYGCWEFTSDDPTIETFVALRFSK